MNRSRCLLACSRSILALSGLALGLGACEYIGGYGEFQPRKPDAGSAGTGQLLPSQLCKPEVELPYRGPTMRPAYNGTSCFWIDSTEVTRSQYDEFLRDPPSASLDPICQANTTFEPAGVSDSGESCTTVPGEMIDGDDHPVVCVDWCDAEAYCGWAGKSLCKDAYNDTSRLESSDWYATCANGTNGTSYSYRGNYNERFCNGIDNGAYCDASHSCGTRPVASLFSCKNDENVFDLIGNAAEWTEACLEDTPQSDCKVRGGSFRDSEWTCGTTRPYPRTARNASIGFRCCFYPCDGRPCPNGMACDTKTLTCVP